MLDTMSVENVNTWISGGGLVGVLTSLNWCRMKIKQQCDIINSMKEKCEKKHDIVDSKFNTVIGKMESINLRLEKAVTLLEERTAHG